MFVRENLKKQLFLQTLKGSASFIERRDEKRELA
jgi:hypothetical protein